MGDKEQKPLWEVPTPAELDAGLTEVLCPDDANAAEQLVERYGDGVYRLTMRITGVKEDAEAAAMDALLVAARQIETFQGESVLSSWIYRIAAKTAYRKLRTRPRASEVMLDHLLPPLDDDGRHFGPMDDWSNRVDDGPLQGELHRILSDAIDALPADYRTALVLHDVEGMSNADIAESLEISVAEVKSLVHRSRLFVRKHLSEHLEVA